MARDTITEEIGGYTYETIQYGTKRSLRIITKISRHAGGALGALFQNMGDKQSILDQKVEDLNIGKIFNEFFETVQDDDLYDFAKDCLYDTMTNNQWLRDATFDQHFKGAAGLMRLMKVIKWVLGVNYSDFLGSIGPGRTATGTSVRVNQTSTPENSTGESGASGRAGRRRSKR